MGPISNWSPHTDLEPTEDLPLSRRVQSFWKPNWKVICALPSATFAMLLDAHRGRLRGVVGLACVFAKVET